MREKRSFIYLGKEQAPMIDGQAVCQRSTWSAVFALRERNRRTVRLSEGVGFVSELPVEVKIKSDLQW